ncbi:MAG: plasmid mobilization relaxosome protein MobC [Alphaproteobacteria bacterium]|nr:plasmid mobilization relaxosome protein MobC [Alphaproteobacteria bacterium]
MKTNTRKNNKRYPFTLKLTFEERAKLEYWAGGSPLAEYIRSRLFDSTVKKLHTRNRHPVKDHKPLAKILAMLGQSRIANNLNQIAKAVNSGSMIIPDETEKIIQDACKAVLEMRDALFKALGLNVEDRS